MLGRLAIALVAAVSLGVGAIPTGVMAGHGGGGGGHGGGGGGHLGGAVPGGGRGISGGPGFSGRGIPGGNPFVSRGVSGQPLSRGVAGNRLAGRGVLGAGPLGHRVSSDHRFAWIGDRRVHGRHLRGFIPGIGYAYYWYYDDCYVLTDDYGWVNVCGDEY
jgi:hypothetical protein